MTRGPLVLILVLHRRAVLELDLVPLLELLLLLLLLMLMLVLLLLLLLLLMMLLLLLLMLLLLVVVMMVEVIVVKGMTRVGHNRGGMWGRGRGSGNGFTQVLRHVLIVSMSNNRRSVQGWHTGKG